MDWTISIACLVIGAIAGFIISQITSSNQNDGGIAEAKLQQAQSELEQYRQEVADHFANTATLMKQMASDYNKIHQHMCQSQEMLLPDADLQHASFTPELLDAKETVDELVDTEQPEAAGKASSVPPNDYVRGSHGIINPAKEEKAATVS